MGAITVIAPKLSKLIPRMGSNHDGEIVATVSAIRRTLEAAGLDFHDLASALSATPEKVEPTQRAEPETWFDLCGLCLDNPHLLSEKELAFLRDISPRLTLGGEPTEKQAAWLRAIYSRVLKEAAH